jgi:hypothetical protein
MRRCLLIVPVVWTAVVVASLWWPPRANAQAATSQGENLSARPPAQLFVSDCTGSGCHRSAQDLVKEMSRIGLASFLREHYTSSRESAAAMAAYLMQLPRTPPSEARPALPPPAARSSRAAARQGEETSATEPAKRGAPSRAQPARQTTAAPPPTPPPPEPPAPPPPKKFDIFD